ncbi:hypothetical protein T4D_7318 [Trichinella pseudospiralis]|uniref:Uncharacterized protein n=1 Tax=Trichinella pseudospiralis TaxID=6337 RepID=A0A0V1G0L8_TRIPS|nr:hypothetical protein T4D_7318 [Trichinella pseudospiralis]
MHIHFNSAAAAAAAAQERITSVPTANSDWPTEQPAVSQLTRRDDIDVASRRIIVGDVDFFLQPTSAFCAENLVIVSQPVIIIIIIIIIIALFLLLSSALRVKSVLKTKKIMREKKKKNV